MRSSVVDASDKKETVAGTLDIAGVESPEELAQQVAQLRLAPQGMPALQGVGAPTEFVGQGPVGAPTGIS